MRRGSRWVLFGCLGLLLVVGIGVAVNLVVAEPRSPAASQAGVTMAGGRVTVVVCEGRGIRDVEIQAGSGDGKLVWQATSLGSAPMDRVTVGDAPGFRVAGAVSLARRQTYAVRVLDDAEGRSLIGTYIVFRPEQLRAGQVITDGGMVSVDDLRSGSRFCP